MARQINRGELLKDFEMLPASAGVSVRVVAALLDRSVASTWRDLAAGRLPSPHKCGRSTRWRVGDLRAALAGVAK